MWYTILGRLGYFMKNKVFTLGVVFFFPLFIAWAQETRPIIRFSPFYTQGIGIEETRFIESLIQSYLSNMGEVVNYFDNSPPSSSHAGSGMFSSDAWTKAPDYVISGSIYLERDNRIFTLEIHNTHTGETSRTTSVHKTASDLVLKARSLVETTFSSPIQIAKGEASANTDGTRKEQPEIITENGIAGTWRGESGIEMIRLQQGGRGVAFFTSGAQMNLTYTIENNVLKVKQDCPNSERFYYPLPYGVARQLSAEADPMSWELLLYAGGTHLKGVRISTEAKVVEDALVQLLPGATRDSDWIRANQRFDGR